jgi:hypothetical protein
MSDLLQTFPDQKFPFVMCSALTRILLRQPLANDDMCRISMRHTASTPMSR